MFFKVKTLIRMLKFNEAKFKLENMKVGANEADRLNLLGFTARKSGRLDVAGKYYDAALKLHPEHIGALEYQGELFLQLGKIEKAKTNLTKLEKICWKQCSAESELRTFIQRALTN